MANEVKPEVAASWLMQTAPHSQHDKNWPGYKRASSYFDYLEKYPHSQGNSVGWPSNWGVALMDKSNPELQAKPNTGVLTPGAGRGMLDDYNTPVQNPDFHRGRGFWNTSF